MRNRLKEWAQGHVTISVRGKRFERLINMAVREGFQVWNVRRRSPEEGQCDILISDYLRLRSLLRETGCRSKVVRREGLPFWLVRMKMRAGFTTGIFLFFAGLYMLSSLIWSVEVVGTKHISTQEVRQAATKIGIKPWAWKVKLKEPQVLQDQLLEMLPEASYVGVELRGTKAIIQVVEKEQPDPAKVYNPRHLIARKKAVIHRIQAEAGKTVVQVNQFVNKGQVLISGIIGNDQRQGVVAARGKVEGEVWYVANVSVPLSQTRHHYTGEQQSSYYLLAGAYAVRLWPFEQVSFQRFEQSEQRHYLGYGDFQLPIGWKAQTQYEVESEQQKLSREEAISLAKRFARMDVLKKAGEDARIKGEKVLHVKEENGKVYLSVHYSVIEDITEEQPIVSLPPAQQPGADKPNQ
ncbi:sporulation protein YqfD [Brevibacillus humidisoli]|uniref:sporulation protein YqfD n=1 Tax=Brevibacillus humidisoli TaxID=2895522 RepID=UPI001E345124|nr:sporulation protein YqfD [Brevibacillus humidisoli]UFJ43151.1 sporulation protein YqfD [Brevibacillus humidisoli]